MKITLRKANAVQLSITAMIKSLSFDSSVQLNEFEPVTAQIDAVRNTFEKHRATRHELVGALYEIRKAVARANADTSINDMLAEVAMLEKEIWFHNIYANNAARLSDAVIEGKLSKLKDAKEDSYYGHSNTVDTGIFTTEEVFDFKRTVAVLDRQKQKLRDTLLELNIQTEIELYEETARFLERADIL